MDEVEMASDDFGESILGVMPGVAREQFQVGIAHVQKDNVTANGIRQRISSEARNCSRLRRVWTD